MQVEPWNTLSHVPWLPPFTDDARGRHQLRMTDATPSCGHCPHCGATIPTGYLLITYDDGGEQSAFAECPDCDSVVTPDDGS